MALNLLVHVFYAGYRFLPHFVSSGSETRRFRDSSSTVGNTLFSLAPWTTAMILALMRVSLRTVLRENNLFSTEFAAADCVSIPIANRSTHFRNNRDNHLAFLDTLLLLSRFVITLSSILSISQCGDTN